MSSIDQQFVEFIVKSLVSKPDAVVIERRIDEKGVLLELTVDPEDLGRVIGKRGATAQSLRTLLRALGTKNDARYNLKIVDNGEPMPNRENRERHEPVGEDGSADTSTRGNYDEAKTENEPEPEDDTPKPKKNEEPSSMASKTRKELEDLDDLDI